MGFPDTVCLLFLTNYYCISQHTHFFFPVYSHRDQLFIRLLPIGRERAKELLESSCKTKTPPEGFANYQMN